MKTTLSPPLTSFDALDASLSNAGFAVIDAISFGALGNTAPDVFTRWTRYWDELPHDEHLLDLGRYRRRRHGCFVVEGDDVREVPHRAHWQPLEYNALHGGIERWFEPLDPRFVADPEWFALLRGLARTASNLRSPQPWFVEAHQFRIDTSDGIGRPTPEGAHRDGVDLVAVVLVVRHAIKGGETRVFDAHGTQGVRFTLQEPWSALLLDDERVVHESTPIQRLDPDVPGHRDSLVITLRRGDFQGPDAA
jgi:hypothetical protein